MSFERLSDVLRRPWIAARRATDLLATASTREAAAAIAVQTFGVDLVASLPALINMCALALSARAFGRR